MKLYNFIILTVRWICRIIWGKSYSSFSPLSLHLRYRIANAMSRRLAYKKEQVVLTNFGSLTKLDLTQYLSAEIFLFGSFEPHVLRLFELIASVSSTRIFFDVGANIGQHSLFAGSQLNASVYSFEPNPVVFKRLVENIVLNNLTSCIQPYNLAIANVPTKIQIVVDSEVNDGTAYIKMVDREHHENSLDATTLALFCREHNISHIDLLKIDVEGAELLVLKGADELLSESLARFIVIEVCETHLNRYFNSAAELISLLNQYGYTGKIIKGNKLLTINTDKIPPFFEGVFAGKDDMAMIAASARKFGFGLA